MRLVLVTALIMGACATTTSDGQRGGASATGNVPRAAAGITYAGGDGLSCDSRVIIQGTESERAGVAAEYAWLRGHYPGFKMGRQTLMNCAGKHADQLRIETATGETTDVFFDISAFFGKGFGL